MTERPTDHMHLLLVLWTVTMHAHSATICTYRASGRGTDEHVHTYRDTVCLVKSIHFDRIHLNEAAASSSFEHALHTLPQIHLKFSHVQLPLHATTFFSLATLSIHSILITRMHHAWPAETCWMASMDAS